jgi:hypothetical protein
MDLALHANATTTPKIRSYIQRSKKPVTELAGELGGQRDHNPSLA